MTSSQLVLIPGVVEGRPRAKARNPEDYLAEIETLGDFCRLYREYHHTFSVPAGPQCTYLEYHPEQVKVRRTRR